MQKDHLMTPDGTILEEDAPHSFLTIACSAQGITGAETVVVAVSEEDNTKKVYYAEAVGKNANWMRGKHGAVVNSGLCRDALKEHHPVLISNVGDGNRVKQNAANNINTAMATSVYHEDRLVGALLLFNKTDGSQFNQKDEATLDEYAKEVGSLIADCLENKEDYW